MSACGESHGQSENIHQNSWKKLKKSSKNRKFYFFILFHRMMHRHFRGVRASHFDLKRTLNALQRSITIKKYFLDFLMIFRWFLMIFMIFCMIFAYLAARFAIMDGFWTVSTHKMSYLRAQTELEALPRHKSFGKYPYGMVEHKIYDFWNRKISYICPQTLIPHEYTILKTIVIYENGYYKTKFTRGSKRMGAHTVPIRPYGGPYAVQN